LNDDNLDNLGQQKMDQCLSGKNLKLSSVVKVVVKSLTSYHLLLTTKKLKENEKGNLENDFADYCEHHLGGTDRPRHYVVHGLRPDNALNL